ncbi:hypothetical protein POM88_010652 [Heracleum sosnowskyi]|uniref:Transposase n=1 Tax=Heracleum sosnowskyi TaxID=360622 RepID=A0AAD8ITW7_9APIA|nr:hypothetical protein POM88_010652 [Heracleum sosnowskyi]
MLRGTSSGIGNAATALSLTVNNVGYILRRHLRIHSFTWIDCPKALRNLLAVIRMLWPDGCVGVKEIDRKFPKFWDDCIDEFLQYYTWDPKFATKDEARASILAVLRDKLRRALADDKKRADAQKKAGETYAQHRPLYMKPGVWSRIAKYWESEEFKKKSETGKKARKAVKLPHTSGARSFDRRRRDYFAKHGKPGSVIVYKDCHTLKNKDRMGEWITEAAKDIIIPPQWFCNVVQTRIISHYLGKVEKIDINLVIARCHCYALGYLSIYDASVYKCWIPGMV